MGLYRGGWFWDGVGGFSSVDEGQAMSDNLVERVARRLCNTAGSNWNAENFNQTDDGSDPEDQREYYRMLAHAAIAVVLEEAADAVGEVGDHADLRAYINAIRALVTEPTDPGPASGFGS